jgi:hypothetical protein
LGGVFFFICLLPWIPIPRNMAQIHTVPTHMRPKNDR